MKNRYILDNEEESLLNEIESSEWSDVGVDESYLSQMSENAKYTKSLQEKRQTTIRFSVTDLAIIKSKAKEMGIGYQNLIQALVHNYATGKVKLEL